MNNKCYKCPQGSTCSNNLIDGCAADFSGSLYQKLLSYAREYCMRPSESNLETPIGIIGDVNAAMDSIRVDMSAVLSAECERQGGIWDPIPEKTPIHTTFYKTTNANSKWGTCLDQE